MPADCLSFAVRVCCKVDLGSVFCFLADPAENITASTDSDVFQIKIMININTQLALGQITYMSLGSFNLISFSQIFSDGFCFCRRFNNDQFLFHGRHVYHSSGFGLMLYLVQFAWK